MLLFITDGMIYQYVAIPYYKKYDTARCIDTTFNTVKYAWSLRNKVTWLTLPVAFSTYEFRISVAHTFKRPNHGPMQTPMRYF